jgi:Xaa-Pro aminopeptidase
VGNLDKLRKGMHDAGVPALIVTDIPNIKWLTGFTGTYGLVLLTETEGRFLTDSRYALQAADQVKDLKIEWFQSPVTGDEFLAKSISDMGLSKVAFESAYVTYSTFEKWRTRLEGVELFGAPDLFAPLRMVKDAQEISLVREACGLADACFDHVKRLIQPGVSEWDINLEIEFYFRKAGHGLAFEPIVVSGERSARPHGKASEKKLEVGDFVTMDFGANVKGYCSDITRTVVVGRASDRHREVYNQVLKAEVECIKAMKPGVRAAEVDALARMILDEKGFAQYFGHGLGHGLGSVVHDFGRMNSSSQDVLEVGQVWTVEPGVYIPGFGGVRIEDDVVVTESGVEVLTKSPKDLLILPA